jgi:trehalose/maltose hydrolase-like predicted phosphorylase
MKAALAPTADPAWVLTANGCDPLRESNYGSRFAVSNGLLGVRGGRVINRPDAMAFPVRTYVAGLFDTPLTEGAGAVLVTAAGWLGVRLLLAGNPLVHDIGERSSHRLTLDLRRGAFATECVLSQTADVVIHAKTLHLVSLDDRCVGLQLAHLEVEQGEVEITLTASFDGLDLGLLPERREQDLSVWRTQASGRHLAMAATASLRIDGVEVSATATDRLEWTWTWVSRPGQAICLDRCVAVERGDGTDADPGDNARRELATARRSGWSRILADHEAAWASRWACSDVAVIGDEAAQQALRFAGYQLNSAANPLDDRVSIGARALTGEDYHGHVFWDTEIFLLPFYIHTWPQAARALLEYRFHTLRGARAKAARLGWKGACYAWESADTGEETTPERVIGPDRRIIEILSGVQEQHISADVAYAVWGYWRATADDAFLREAGAEIVLETARFWSSRAQMEADGRRHIRGVIGPDEYHEHIDDNAFTNVMARWNIRRALDIVALFKTRWPEDWTRLSSHLELDDAELGAWADAATTLTSGLDARTGLFEQFAGYFDLEEIDLADYAGRSVPMDVVLGRERTAASKVVKQADVVALLALLPEEFASGAAAINFDYYEPRCSHGSSLSRAMHAIAAARLGKTELALRYFRETAAIDLADTHVAIGGGIHIAALGGLWQIAVLGFAGLSLLDDGIAFDPKLPVGWRGLAFPMQWRGRSLNVTIDRVAGELQVTLASGEAMTVQVDGKPHGLTSGHPLLIRYAHSGLAAG